MRDVLSKPASTDIARVAAALKQQFDAGSGLSRVRILITEGKGRKPTPLKWSPRETLDRLLEWDDFVDEAAEFERRAAPSEEFWKDWLSAAMSAPSEFRARSKLTVKKQIAAIRSITTAAARLQKTLEHALVVPSPDLSETKYPRGSRETQG